ncbi:MAG: serine hydrolase domain-containing protein [Saprospiraceae bacterium]|nr:serine hydrolase domain-containing protein [Saprospiraceae bacterium]
MNRKTLSRVIILVLLFFVLQYASFRTQGADNPKPSSRYYHEIQEGRELLTELLDNFPGVSIAVGIGDRIAWKEAFGWADAKNKIYATPEHQFRYYSLSKSIAGLAAAKLMEEGKLDIDTAITTYLPDLPEQYCDVTVAQLLSHTAGVRHYKKDEWQKISQYHCNTVEEALPVFLEDKLKFEPGAGYTYTSFGYVLLCYVLEAVSGVPYDEYIHQNFLLPLGLETIALDQQPAAQVNPVKFYKYWNVYKNRGVEAPKVDNSCKFGGGGYVGTAEELVHLHQAVIKGRLIRPETVEQYFTSFTKSDSTSVGYAFGIGVKESSDGSKYYAHTGTAMGGYGVLIVDPAQELVIVILGNRYDEALVTTAKKILKVFRGTV